MNEKTFKTFDCVENMREARERLGTELGDKSCEDMVRLLRSHQYADPFLRQLAERAAQQGDEAYNAVSRR